MPPKLSARTRVFATGQGRKTDATDAHSVALVGTRMGGLRPVVADEQLTVCGCSWTVAAPWVKSTLARSPNCIAILLELMPGGAKQHLSAAQAKSILAGKCARVTTAGKTRKRFAAELVTDLQRIYRRTKAADKELRALLVATGTTLMRLHGIGPTGAARLLVEVGDITRFPNREPLRLVERHRPDRGVVWR